MAVAERPSSPGLVRRIAFNTVAVVFVLMCLVLSPLPFVFLGWFIEDDQLAASHRIHEISFGLVFLLCLVAALALLRKPRLRIAQTYQMAVPIALLVASFFLVDRGFDVIALLFLIMPALLIALHPVRTQVLRPRFRPSALLLAAAAVAAVPLLVFSVQQFATGVEAAALAKGPIEALPEDASDKDYERALARATDTQAELETARHYGHWSAMGSFALIVVFLSAIGALRPQGWRFPAWSAAVAVIVYGAASLAFPGSSSGADGLVAILAVAWGIGFIVAAEIEVRRDPAARAREVASPA
jgi:hypothetical protein